MAGERSTSGRQRQGRKSAYVSWERLMGVWLLTLKQL